MLALEHVSDGGEYPHQLNISRYNNTLPNEIDEYVHELMVLAEKNNGCYDGWGLRAGHSKTALSLAAFRPSENGMSQDKHAAVFCCADIP
ncbi:Uncharacterised protein [Neisseria zoodegmatis]|uniref:Regulator of ribonuclease activity B domain-containing protein n=1 Tax=Neisseria zoodegmatis TaxID=326523 RepID=A0AB38DUS6_9NEIS|nr:hypothetical protein BWD10_06025 [Neisseria zoodegmatis]SNU80746.1 Uncharacterised protein [Neisseria zoodegmatis]